VPARHRAGLGLPTSCVGHHSLTDGEDFELLFTVPGWGGIAARSLEGQFPDLRLSCIGKITAAPGLACARPTGLHALSDSWLRSFHEALTRPWRWVNGGGVRRMRAADCLRGDLVLARPCWSKALRAVWHHGRSRRPLSPWCTNTWRPTPAGSLDFYRWTTRSRFAQPVEDYLDGRWLLRWWNGLSAGWGTGVPAPSRGGWSAPAGRQLHEHEPAV